MMLLYPKSSFTKGVDEAYEDEYKLIAPFVPTGIIDFDAISSGDQIVLPPHETFLYRGWMFTLDEYALLEQSALQSGSQMMVSTQEYENAHYITSWYDLIKNHTAETVFGTENSLPDIPFENCFVKDFVKSSSKSLCHKNDIQDAIHALKKHRRVLEGGIAIRHQETYTPPEHRVFVLNNTPNINPNVSLPQEALEIIQEITSKIQSPFYSIDMAQRSDGLWRVIEIGDGQVSDKKEWQEKDFTKLIKNNFFKSQVNPKPSMG